MRYCQFFSDSCPWKRTCLRAKLPAMHSRLVKEFMLHSEVILIKISFILQVLYSVRPDVIKANFGKIVQLIQKVMSVKKPGESQK